MHIDYHMLFHSIESVLTFFIIGCVGYFLAWRGWFSKESTALISKLITKVALPIFLLYNIDTILTRDELLHLAYGLPVPFISILLTLGVSAVLARLLALPHEQRGLFTASSAFSNTVYVGLPVCAALFGPKGIPYVLIYYFANTTMVWTIGNYLIASGSSEPRQRIFSMETVKRILPPPMIGLIIGLALLFMNMRLPGFLSDTAKYIGALTTPLVTMSLGITMFTTGFAKMRFDWELVGVLFGRYVTSPLMVLLISRFFPVPDLMFKVFIICASLPAMSSTAMIAAYYKGDVERATVIVSITTLLAVVTVPLFMMLVS